MQLYLFSQLFAVRMEKAELSLHQHAGYGVGIALRSDAEVVATHSGARAVSAPGMVIGPRRRYALRAESGLVSILLDPVLSWSITLRQEGFPVEGIRPLHPSGTALEAWQCLADMLRASAPCERVRQQCAVVLNQTFQCRDVLGTCDPRVREVAKRILDRPASRVHVAELARLVGLSDTRLIHVFQRDAGVTVRALMRWVRLKMAFRLLVEGMPPTDAALEAGFSDLAHFSRSFRQSFGLSPTSALKGPPRADVRVCLGHPGEPTAPVIASD